MNIHNLNAKTNLPLGPHAQREAAARCLAILLCCTEAVPTLNRAVATGNADISSPAVLNLFTVLHTHGQALRSDLATLSAMIGCEMTVVDPSKGAQA